MGNLIELLSTVGRQYIAGASRIYYLDRRTKEHILHLTQSTMKNRISPSVLMSKNAIYLRPYVHQTILEIISPKTKPIVVKIISNIKKIISKII